MVWPTLSLQREDHLPWTGPIKLDGGLIDAFSRRLRDGHGQRAHPLDAVLQLDPAIRERRAVGRGQANLQPIEPESRRIRIGTNSEAGLPQALWTARRGEAGDQCNRHK